MSITILYLKGTTACWTLWKRGKLAQVCNEVITQNVAMRASEATAQGGIHSECPWLGRKHSRVRIVIDPTTDQTQSIPAFDYGYTHPKTAWGRIQSVAERCYASCRTVTCDIVNDDPARYRRNQLRRHSDAVLQWHRPSFTLAEKESELIPSTWVLTESFLPNFVFDWLQAMALQGIEFLDTRPVSSLFALADEKISDVVIHIWVETQRSRVMVSAQGAVQSVEQWRSENDAIAAAEDEFKLWQEKGVHPALRISHIKNEIALWKNKFSGISCELRSDGLKHEKGLAVPLVAKLPGAFVCLPLSALLLNHRADYLQLANSRAVLDVGKSFRRLSRVSRWRKRRQEALVATTAVAACSGYFVLLAMMHALQVIELHDDVQHELNSIREKQTNLQHSLQQLHENPDKALAAINHFNSTSTLSTSNQQSFLGHIANTLKTQSAIELNGVSWRYTEELYWSADEPQGLVELTELHDLDVNPFADETSIKDRLVLLSGLVDVTMNQQQASQVLMDFVNALADIDSVLDVVPVSSTFSSAPAMTLPSDARASTDSASAFVVALRILV